MLNHDCRSYFQKQLGSMENKLLKQREENRKKNEHNSNDVENY